MELEDSSGGHQNPYESFYGDHKFDSNLLLDRWTNRQNDLIIKSSFFQALIERTLVRTNWMKALWRRR